MKFPKNINKRPKFHAVRIDSDNYYIPWTRATLGASEVETFYFYGYKERLGKSPNKVIINNLTNPNQEDWFDASEKLIGQYRVTAHNGDILTIETECERHVICVFKNTVYSLLSSTANNSWHEEVKQAIFLGFQLKLKRED